MGLGVLIILFLFGFALFGVSGTRSTGSGTATARSVAIAPAATPLTQADTGRTIVLGTGARRSLRLSHKWSWPDPLVTGGSVRLERVSYTGDPGFDEWTIVAVKPGTSTIKATTTPTAAGSGHLDLVVRVH